MEFGVLFSERIMIHYCSDKLSVVPYPELTSHLKMGEQATRRMALGERVGSSFAMLTIKCHYHVCR